MFRYQAYMFLTSLLVRRDHLIKVYLYAFE